MGKYYNFWFMATPFTRLPTNSTPSKITTVKQAKSQ